MVTLQQQARALGDPTRHGVFRYLADAGHPVGVAELTAHFGLNHNAIRQHLAKLLDADLVVEGRMATGGPGRPRLVYEVDPTAESRWGVTGPYERLSVLLAEIIRTGETPREIGRRAGERYRSGTATDAEATIVEVAEAMAREGFEPDVRRTGGRVEIVLQNCPFANTAAADPQTICSLHEGIAEGVAGPDGPVVVERLEAHDPHEAGCRLCLRVEHPA
ncbi:helix-turn-helix transcriptional regulator [Actinomarinicola tropica]|uniref:helix-turn-helix transcriptional regulator n=1 Tax=Actinomarinicola tropica TaxID=2789776 RepID=UPI001E47CB6F|nr:helix-turn-helix domain-containing protein [Actinomarinicola tropica]